MSEVVLNPRVEQIRRACAEFELENQVIEDAVRDLFRQYPANTHKPHVLLKVNAVNTLYSTQIPLYSARVPTVLDLVDHIIGSSIDPELSQGVEALVPRIAGIQVPEKAGRFYYVFATKYCSWHKPTSYPINDSRVRLYLSHLRDQGCLDRFSENDLWDYAKFKRVVEEFRTKNGLGNFTFKEIDKFMYIQGSLLLMGRKEREIQQDETILVPAPDQPNEMEWSVENYPSPEDAEMSLKKFTDSAGLVTRTKEGKHQMWDGEKWVAQD